MSGVWAAFKDCGSISFLVLVVGIVGVTAGIGALVGAVVSKTRAGMFAGFAAVALALACLSLGALGMLRGRSMTDEALSGGSLSPEQAARIHEEGYREAGQCVSVGGANAALPLLLGLSGIAITFARKR